jgi:ribosome maturation factor RimP
MDINKQRIGLDKKFFHLCEPLVIESGYRLYDLQYIPATKTLRLFIENPNTKTALIEDCVKVDHALNTPFETEDWIPEGIVLEVSSPGIYRELTSLEHFKSYLQSQVLVVIMGKLSDEQIKVLPKEFWSSKKILGILSSVGDKNIELNVNGKKIRLDFTQIKKVTLEPDLDFKEKSLKGEKL